MKILLSFFIAFLLVGCDAAKVTSLSNVTQTSDKYFGAVAKCTGLPESKYLEDKINLMLKESKLLNENLIINCALVKYHKGSRARRYWNYGNRIGVGYSEVNVDITNKNNKEIYKFNVYQEITWGNFGGNPKWVLENTAKEIVKEVKNKLISKENNGH